MGVSPLKGLGGLKVVPLKLQGPNLERRLAPRQLGLFQLKSFKPTLGIGPKRPSSQPGVDSVYDHVV
jgi:hypothetical protein